VSAVGQIGARQWAREQYDLSRHAPGIPLPSRAQHPVGQSWLLVQIGLHEPVTGMVGKTTQIKPSQQV
jgi:hypothetical protein